MHFSTDREASDSRHVYGSGDPVSDLAQLEQVLSARAYLFTLFHKTFGGRPTAELLEAVLAPETVDALKFYSTRSRACADMRLYSKTLSFSAIQGGFLLRASAEYSRLFDDAQPRCIVPRGSMFCIDTMPRAVSAAEMMDLLETHGLKPRSGHTDCGDHVSLMCAFGAVLAQNALVSMRAGDLDTLRSSISSQLSFSKDRLASWLPRFADKLTCGKTSFLYPQMARCLAEFVEHDEAFCEHALSLLAGLDSIDVLPRTGATEFEQGLDRIRDISLSGLEKHEICAV